MVLLSKENTKVIAEQIIDALSKREIPAYPIEQHLPETVIQQYEIALEINS